MVRQASQEQIHLWAGVSIAKAVTWLAKETRCSCIWSIISEDRNVVSLGNWVHLWAGKLSAKSVKETGFSCRLEKVKAA